MLWKVVYSVQAKTMDGDQMVWFQLLLWLVHWNMMYGDILSDVPPTNRVSPSLTSLNATLASSFLYISNWRLTAADNEMFLYVHMETTVDTNIDNVLGCVLSMIQ